jgi:hypothetical protein
MNRAGREFVIGQDRCEPKAVAHLYLGEFRDPGNPMCVRGWNRDGGFGYSIFRNSPSGAICLRCLSRAAAGRDSVSARERKTKWT